jgi:riboflavin synthase
MFTGLVREVGLLEAVERSDAGALLRVRAGLAAELEPGESVAVSGACLTVAASGDGAFAADVMNQTLRLTTLDQLEPGARVNLEPALRANARIGGHLVQGHVDGRAAITAVEADGIARRLSVTLPPELRRYVIEHGSVALDGVSLTVASLTEDGLEVSLIPETLERTTLGEAAAGGELNVEVDQIARYVERLVTSFKGKGSDG